MAKQPLIATAADIIGPLRRIQVQADDIAALVLKVRVLRNLERPATKVKLNTSIYTRLMETQ